MLAFKWRDEQRKKNTFRHSMRNFFLNFNHWSSLQPSMNNLSHTRQQPSFAKLCTSANVWAVCVVCRQFFKESVERKRTNKTMIIFILGLSLQATKVNNSPLCVDDLKPNFFMISAFTKAANEHKKSENWQILQNSNSDQMKNLS